MKRGLSEIISAILVISIVVAGLGIYTSLAQQRILGDVLSVRETIEQKDDQISELVKIVGMFRNSEQSDVIGVFVHNYGLKNVTMSEVYVNGTIRMGSDVPNPIYVRDMQELVVFPNTTLPQGKTSEIILNFTDFIELTNGIESLVIQTDSNKLIEFLNDTG